MSHAKKRAVTTPVTSKNAVSRGTPAKLDFPPDMKERVEAALAERGLVPIDASTPEPRESVPTLSIDLEDGQTEEQAIAKASMSPETGAMMTRTLYRDTAFANVDPNEHVQEIRRQVKRAQSNDMDGVVALLVSQAHTLDAIFNKLATKAAKALDLSSREAFEIYLRQALRAQAQCRSTLEAVAEVKNPRPVSIIKQQNNAQGHQQVNNGGPAVAHARAHESTKEQLALSEKRTIGDENGERMDGRAPCEAGGSDQALETVGAVDGSEKRSWEADLIEERHHARCDDERS